MRRPLLRWDEVDSFLYFHTHTLLCKHCEHANTSNTIAIARFYKYFRCRSFTQHWIMVGKRLRVLLLDFDAKFTLLIPNIEPGKAFRINKADVEVQTKELEGGVKLTFMKFLFQSPQLEIKAPVLNDKEVGYRVLSQNGACVFLKRILNLPPLELSGHEREVFLVGRPRKEEEMQHTWGRA